MDPQITPIIDLDLIISLVPQAQELTKQSIERGDYAEAPAVDSDFLYVERGDWHFVYWLDADNDAHRISRAKNERVARFLIGHMTDLIKLHVRMQRGRPVAATKPAAPVADADTISLSIPSGSPLKKQILFDRNTGDFAMYFEGSLVGYAPSYIDADTRLNKLAHEVLRRRAA